MRSIHETKYWLERAQEARSLAETFGDPIAREAMLGIAAGYEDTAKKLASEPIASARKKSVEHA